LKEPIGNSPLSVSNYLHSPEELINSHILLNSVFEISPIPLAITDVNGTLIRMNEACRKALIITNDQAVGKYNILKDSVIESQGFLPLIRDVYEKKSLAHFIVYCNTKDLKGLLINASPNVIFDINISPIVDAQGKLTNAIIQYIDITEKRKIHDELRRSEEKYSNLIKNLNVGIVLQGPKAEILLSNSRALELLGVTEDQLLGKTSYDSDWNIIHEDGSAFTGPTHPVPLAIVTKKPVIDVVMGVYRPKTNDRAWLSVNAEPELNSNGGVEQVICTFIDVTKHRKLKESFREAERFSRSVVNALSSEISIIDETGLILSVNSVWRKFAEANLNVPINVSEGANYFTVCDATFGPDAFYAKAMAAGIRSVINGEQASFSQEYPCDSPTEKRWFNAVVTRFDEYSPIRIVIDHENITERKRSEKEVMRLNTELRDLSNHLQNATEEERSAIAKEIHNEFVQNLVALTMKASYLKSKIKDLSKENKEIIEEQIEIANGLINTNRILFNSLHPSVLDELGLESAIGWYTKTKLKSSDIQFVFNTNIVEERFSKEISLGLFRIFQECLTNVLLHSKANKVIVYINKFSSTIIMEIQDNGIGFNNSKVDTKLHHGLLEMRERVYALNGEFILHSVKGDGVSINVKIPI